MLKLLRPWLSYITVLYVKWRKSRQMRKCVEKKSLFFCSLHDGNIEILTKQCETWKKCMIDPVWCIQWKHCELRKAQNKIHIIKLILMSGTWEYMCELIEQPWLAGYKPSPSSTRPSTEREPSSMDFWTHKIRYVMIWVWTWKWLVFPQPKGH